MNTIETTVHDVRDVLVHVLGIEDRAASIDAETALLGALPELDSLAVVELVVALEDRFAVDIHDSDLTGEVFETVGTLAEFIDDRRR
jgi:acyl carrier protein